MSGEASLTETRKPRRRWTQFSLRALLLLMVAVAVVAALMGREYRKALRQKHAIAWVEELGGSIEYDDVATDDDWRRRWFGEWFPESVENVAILNPSRTSGEVLDIAPLAAFEKLRILQLGEMEISDVSVLEEMRNLELIFLFHATLNDEQVQALREALPDCDIHISPSPLPDPSF